MPITIDGTDVTAITIDGTDVTEVTIDGAVVWQSAADLEGVIIMLNNSTVPEGWFLCDGSNGTPDLSDHFIEGTVTSPGIHATSGEHNHGTTGSGGNHKHDHYLWNGVHTHGASSTGVADRDFRQTDPDAGIRDITNHLHDGSSSWASHTHSTSTVAAIPPYYILAFIMKG